MEMKWPDWLGVAKDPVGSVGLALLQLQNKTFEEFIPKKTKTKINKGKYPGINLIIHKNPSFHK